MGQHFLMIKFTSLLKKAFRWLGFELGRLKNYPGHKLLGLKSLPIRTIIDIGANTGQFSQTIVKDFPGANVYCFEPVPEAFSELENWARKQEKVSVFNLAIGEKAGMIDMYHHKQHSPSSSILLSTEVSEKLYPFTRDRNVIPVQMTTLDDVVKKMNGHLDDDILIKLDVQGFENRVIKGGDKTFRKAKACILEVSLDQLYQGQANFKELLLLMDECGFNYAGNLDQTFAEDGHCVFLDAVFIK